MTLKHQILQGFKRKPEEWIHKERVCDYARQQGYSSENAGRRLRELAEEGFLERKMVGKSVSYSYKARQELLI